ncbi:MAG: pyruvate kinase alpha/beta domain-containing protein [Candidatus Bathyarchaeia archaeon]
MASISVEKIVYFESGGRHNTDHTLKLAKERAQKRGIKNVIVASIAGFTAERALEIFKDTDIKLTIVSISGPQFPGFPEDLRRRIEQMGHNFCYASDVKYEFPEVVQDTLRRFCEGLKVCVEVALVATEMGFVKPKEEVIAVGGTGRLGYEKGGGADTAIVIEAMKSKDFLELETIFGKKEERRKIKEIICKPR